MSTTRLSPPADPRRRLLASGLLGLLVLFALIVSHHSVGYARDEGIYMQAGRQYASAWRRGDVWDRRARDRAFRLNNEHPALPKTVFGLSAATFANGEGTTPRGAVPVLREGAAMRLPAQVLTAAGAATLMWVGMGLAGLSGGLLAAGSFVLLPRVWFHGGLAAFDLPVAVLILWTVLAYQAALRDGRFAPVLALCLGLAGATKHNAIFIVPVLLAHYGFCLWRTSNRRPWHLAPPALLLTAVVAPLVVWVSWPWLWSDTFARLQGYLEFHAEHAYYNMVLWGQNHNEPPMPASYPWVMTAATVPLAWIFGLGLGLCVRSRATVDGQSAPGVARPWAPLAGARTYPQLLWVGCALMPVLLIAHPAVPIFGGTKHWLTAYPFCALLIVYGYARFRPQLSHRLRSAWVLAALGPIALTTLSGHPHNLSQYSGWWGGARGAANLGLNPGFWGVAVTPLLPELSPAPIHAHDIHATAADQYIREGRWPGDAKLRSSHQDAAQSLHFYEPHMHSDELRTWARQGTERPTALVELDDVPLASLYGDP